MDIPHTDEVTLKQEIDFGELQVSKEARDVLDLFNDNQELPLSLAQEKHKLPNAVLIDTNYELCNQGVQIFYDRVRGAYIIQQHSPVNTLVTEILKRGMKILDAVNFGELTVNGKAAINVNQFHYMLLELLIEPCIKKEEESKKHQEEEASNDKNNENFGIQVSSQLQDLEKDTGKIHVKVSEEDFSDEFVRGGASYKLYKLFTDYKNKDRIFRRKDLNETIGYNSSRTIIDLNEQLENLGSNYRVVKVSHGRYKYKLLTKKELESWGLTEEDIHTEISSVGTKAINESENKTTQTIKRNGFTFEFYQSEETDIRRISINGKTTEDLSELLYLIMLNCVKSKVYGYTLPEAFVKSPSTIFRIKNYFSDNNLPFEIIDNVVLIK